MALSTWLRSLRAIRGQSVARKPRRPSRQAASLQVELLECRAVPDAASSLFTSLDTACSYTTSLGAYPADVYRIQNTANQPVTFTVKETWTDYAGIQIQKVSQDQTFTVAAKAAVLVGPFVNARPESFAILSAAFSGPVANAPISDLSVRQDQLIDAGAAGTGYLYGIHNLTNQTLSFTLEETWSPVTPLGGCNDVFQTLTVGPNSVVELPTFYNVIPNIKVVSATFVGGGTTGGGTTGGGTTGGGTTGGGTTGGGTTGGTTAPITFVFPSPFSGGSLIGEVLGTSVMGEPVLGSIVKIDPLTGTQTTIWQGTASTGWEIPDLAVESNGTIVFAGFVNNQSGICQIDPAASNPTPSLLLPVQLANAPVLAPGPAGTLYGANGGQGSGGQNAMPGSIVRINPTTGAQTTIWQGAAGTADGPRGDSGDLQVESNGTIIFIGYFNGQLGLYQINPAVSNATPSLLASYDKSLFLNGTLAIGPTGTLYAGLLMHGAASTLDFKTSIVQINPTTGAQTTIWQSADNGITTMAVVPDGTIVFSGSVAGQFGVYTIDPSALNPTPSLLGTNGSGQGTSGSGQGSGGVGQTPTVQPTFQWSGNGANSRWSNGANWLGGQAPTAGSNLVFPYIGKVEDTQNDLGLTFGSITTQSDYEISGTPLTVSGPIDVQTGTLTLDTSASVNGFTVDAGEALVVSSGSKLTTQGTATVNGALYVNGTVSLTNKAALLVNGFVSIGSSGVVSDQDANIVGVGATLDVSGTLQEGADGNLDIFGTATIEPGATLDAFTTITIEPGGALIDSGAATIEVDGSVSVLGTLSVTSTGSIEVFGQVIFGPGAIYDPEGAIAVEPEGTLDLTNPVLSNLSAPTITEGTMAVTITGQLLASSVIPEGETVQVAINGVPQNATLDGSDSFSASFDTSNLTAADSPYTISVSYPGDATFSGATATSELTVLAVPEFSNLNAPTITEGTATTTVSGHLGFSDGSVIPALEPVGVSLNGVTQIAPLDSGGNFSTSFATGDLSDTNSPYALEFSYSGDADNAATLGASSLTVSQQATPTVQAASESTTYSGSLQAYPLNASDVTVSGPNGLTSSGGTLSYAYNGSIAVPKTAGTYTVTVTFVPNDTTDYTSASTTTTWTIKPATLSVATSNSLMLAGKCPPPLAGFVNGKPFTGSTTYTTAFGDKVTITLSTTATSASPVGQYAITASLSGAAGNYVIAPTYGTMYVVSLGADPSDPAYVESVGFWENSHNAKAITAADLSSLDGLNLVNQGGAAFDPRSVAQLQAWLSTPGKPSAAYQLAAQLAVLDLNVLSGYVKATDLVFAGGLLPYLAADHIAGLINGGFIDVQDLMSAANTTLDKGKPGCPWGDLNQAYETALAQVLTRVNGNTDFVAQEELWSLFGVYASLRSQGIPVTGSGDHKTGPTKKPTGGDASGEWWWIESWFLALSRERRLIASPQAAAG